MQTLERIRVLDADTIAQIAAGEVIERPVSVVKELAENSLDAGATWIAVELRGGGRSEIIVADDGRGIIAEDLPLALRRHSTSKLAAASDLFSVRTLGFRGEGLASVAAACGSLEIVSRSPGQNFGARIVVRHGSPGEVGRAAASPGTRVTVRDLFALTPVRREFLGTEKTEFSRISSFLSRIALGWPRVAFTLRHEGKDVWSLPAVEGAVERLEMVFGRGSRGSLTPVYASPNMMIGIGGFTSRIGADRPNRHGQVIFVNGRLVRNPALSAAWSAAYANKIMTGRYPFGVLMLSVPAGDVDVNVHPTKIEVRFISAAAVFDVVKSAVGDAINNVDAPNNVGADLQVGTPNSIAADLQVGAAPNPSISLLTGFSDPRGVSPTADVRALGQIDHTFVLMSDRHELLIIDQHAAHERIAFEALESGGNHGVSAPLLVPQIVELTKDQVTVLESYRDELADMGAVVEQFGDDAYRITALPSGYGERHFDLIGILEDLAGDSVVADLQVGSLATKRRQKLLASVACHSVVRAHESLSAEEQVALYERLRSCREPQTCPHGRPTLLRFNAETLAKAFRRT